MPNSPETRVADALSFLLDRLNELDWSQSKADIERDFHGHVVPASACASDVLAALPDPTPDAATIEQAAREIWAAELVGPLLAEGVAGRDRAAIRAISTALRSRSDLRDLALEEAAKIADETLANNGPFSLLPQRIRALKSTPITTAGDLG